MDPNDRAQKKPPPRSQRQSQPQNAKRREEAKDYGKLSGNDNRSILSSGTAATMETAAAAALLDQQIAGQRQKGAIHAASNSNGNGNSSNPESFRLVEFFTFASKPFVYSVVIGFYLAVVVGVRMATAKVFQTTYT
mmetsp:Transcript_6324/g.15691  ORF Transcript_6324/g.15691 Transcript_6324/m.15691 type:complete len:136 (+) Transcript_6324:412-819(+)